MFNFLSAGYEYTLYTIKKNVDQQPLFSGDIYKIVQFRSDPIAKVFQRSIYNILDFIGDVGGLLDGLKLIA